MPTAMSKRNDESVWCATTNRRARSAQDFGDSDFKSDEVVACLLERGQLDASVRERRALDEYLARLHRIELAGGPTSPDADEIVTLSLGEA